MRFLLADHQRECREPGHGGASGWLGWARDKHELMGARELFFDFDLPPRIDAALLVWDCVAGEWVTWPQWVFRCSHRREHAGSK